MIFTKCTLSPRKPNESPWRRPAFLPAIGLDSPLGFKGNDANLYRYVGNNATNATDPSGLDRLEFYETTGKPAVYYVNEGWFWDDPPVFLGYLDTRYNIVQRGKHKVSLQAVREEVNAWGTTDDWDAWFENHHLKKLDEPTQAALRMEMLDPYFFDNSYQFEKKAKSLAWDAVLFEATGPMSASPRAVGLGIKAATVSKEGAKNRGAWALGPGIRGEVLEAKLGQNLPRTFEAIDRFTDGVATSIKTFDLASRTYKKQNAAGFLSKLKEHIDTVARFKGATLKNVEITESMIKARALRVGIEPGVANSFQVEAMKKAIEYGVEKGVAVEFIPIRLVADETGDKATISTTPATEESPDHLHETLRSGVIFVSIEDPEGKFDRDQLARIHDAVVTLNAFLGPLGTTLREPDDGSNIRADIRIQVASASPCGSAYDGVLGCTAGSVDQREVTLLAGWDWYTGEDPHAINSEQYDYQTIVTHELGHALGLSHGEDPASAMYWKLAHGVSHGALASAAFSPYLTDTGVQTHVQVPDVACELSVRARSRLDTYWSVSVVIPCSFAELIGPPARSGLTITSGLDEVLVGGEGEDLQVREFGRDILVGGFVMGNEAVNHSEATLAADSSCGIVHDVVLQESTLGWNECDTPSVLHRMQ